MVMWFQCALGLKGIQLAVNKYKQLEKNDEGKFVEREQQSLNAVPENFAGKSSLTLGCSPDEPLTLGNGICQKKAAQTLTRHHHMPPLILTILWPLTCSSKPEPRSAKRAAASTMAKARKSVAPERKRSGSGKRQRKIARKTMADTDIIIVLRDGPEMQRRRRRRNKI